MAASFVDLDLDGRNVKISNPEKVFFPKIGVSKLDLVNYYLSVSDGVLRALKDRPTLLKRYPDGVDGESFYQKRAPNHRPDWIQTVEVTFPSGRRADFLSPADAAHVIWAINLGCLELHPWPVRREDVDHPDELRIDLDPTPEASWSDVRRLASIVKETLDELGMRGFPKLSGKRGIHIYVRIEPEHGFSDVRRAALAFARLVESRVPELATTAWWKEERHGVFIDYNQNARDRTIACAYSVRPTSDARVSFPLSWDEVSDAEPQDFTLLTVPGLFDQRGDAHASIDEVVHRLDPLFELAARQEAEGAQDAPWPPQFPKAEGEPKRVAPSRAKKQK